MRRKVDDLPPMPPGYNNTPGTFQPVVRLDEETSEREMVLMEWGLVPYWSDIHRMISNCARDDKLTSGGAWIKPFQQRRCLIPGEFFYEWEVLGPEEKRRKVTKPWAVALKDDRLFSFGGIWDRWKDRDTGNVLESFAIVTVDPNEVLEPFHNRCPLMGRRGAVAPHRRWAPGRGDLGGRLRPDAGRSGRVLPRVCHRPRTEHSATG